MSPDARNLLEALADEAPMMAYGTGVQHGPAYPERFLLRDGLQFLGIRAIDRLARRAAQSAHGDEVIFRRCDVCGAQERFSELSPTGMRRLVWEHDGAKHFTAAQPVAAPRRRERTADDEDDYATSSEASLRRMRQAMDARPRQVMRLVGGPEDA